MQRKFGIALLTLLLLVTQLVVPAAANPACVPDMNMTIVPHIKDLLYSVELNEADCGAPHVIDVAIALDYITRPTVNDAWSAPANLEYHNISAADLPMYSNGAGIYEINDQRNVYYQLDNEYSKFRLRVVIRNQETGAKTVYDLGWLEGPNDAEVSGGFEGRPGGLTPQQNQGAQLRGQN